MGKNRIGQISNEPIWQKSRLRQVLDQLKDKSLTTFSLRNGYPIVPDADTNPPSYREYYTPVQKRREEPKPVREDKQPLTTTKTIKQVSCCMKSTNYIIGIGIFLSLILSVIGTSTPYWFDTGTLDVGLFRACMKSGTCTKVSAFTEIASSTTPNTWLITSGLCITGCCLLFVCLLYYIVYSHCTTLDYRKVSCGVLLTICVLLGACAMLSGMTLMLWYYFDIRQIYTFGWSFYVATSGGGLAFITFCIMIVYVFALAFQ